VIYELAFAMISITIKFEVSISVSDEDMEGDTKCRKWGGLRQLGVTESH